MSKKNNKWDIYAVVEEDREQLFVTTLTGREMDDMGDCGVERLVRDWCDRNGKTFVDYAV